MYKINIIKHYKYKQHWLDWLKYKLPIPKHITPLKMNNLIGGYGTYNKLRLAMCEKTQRDTTNFLVSNMSAKLNTKQNLKKGE